MKNKRYYQCVVHPIRYITNSDGSQPDLPISEESKNGLCITSKNPSIFGWKVRSFINGWICNECNNKITFSKIGTDNIPLFDGIPIRPVQILKVGV